MPDLDLTDLRRQLDAGHLIDRRTSLALIDRLEKAEAALIAEPAECVASCDDPNCHYMHTPLTWRDRAEKAEADLLSAVRRYSTALASCREDALDAALAVIKRKKDEWARRQETELRTVAAKLLWQEVAALKQGPKP
jgi:hypothetical protein